MARGVINTRIELDPVVDNELKELARTENRSKRQMGALLISRVLRRNKTNPDALRELQIVRDEK